MFKVIDAIRLDSEGVMNILRKDSATSDEEVSDEDDYDVRAKSIISKIAFYQFVL